MNYVIEHIDYLVRRHECVVLPSWGAFIAHFRPAFYDIERGLMLPPARLISFNTNVEHTDGILASSIARREGISFEKASQIVAREIEAMKHQLEHDGEIALGNIGKFTYQKGLAPLFEPSERYNASASAFMRPLSIIPVANQAQENAIKERIQSHKARSRKRRLALRTAKIAAAIAVFATVAVSLINFGGFIRNDNLASVTEVPQPTNRSTQTAIVPGSDANELCLNIALPAEKPVTISRPEAVSDIVPATPVAAPAAQAEKPTTAPAAATAVAPVASEGGQFCLIVASLPTEQLARKFIAESGDSNLQVLAKDGKYRVYAASASTYDGAVKQKSAEPIASKYPDAWVCRR